MASFPLTGLSPNRLRRQAFNQGEVNALRGQAIQGPNPNQVAQFSQQQALAGAIQAGASNPFAAARSGAGAATGALLQQQMQVQEANERARSFAAQREQQRQQFAQQRRDGFLRQGLQMGGMALGGLLSDERSKENVSDGSQAIDQFLQSMNPANFQHREGMPGGRQEPQTGVMAQDLMQSQVGQQMVEQGPGGMQQINPADALQSSMAALARLDERLRAIEGRFPTNTMRTQG